MWPFFSEYSDVGPNPKIQHTTSAGDKENTTRIWSQNSRSPQTPSAVSPSYSELAIGNTSSIPRMQTAIWRIYSLVSL